MKVAILAGGLGTHLSEETTLKPKPMVEVGGMPVLWHIMKIYGSYGYNEFVVALGYKGEIIKDYFLKYHLMSSCLTDQHPEQARLIGHHHDLERTGRFTCLDTGPETNTGGRCQEGSRVHW
jgi:glucose-1-phosphate cytidylyltransferase